MGPGHRDQPLWWALDEVDRARTLRIAADGGGASGDRPEHRAVAELIEAVRGSLSPDDRAALRRPAPRCARCARRLEFPWTTRCYQCGPRGTWGPVPPPEEPLPDVIEAPSAIERRLSAHPRRWGRYRSAHFLAVAEGPHAAERACSALVARLTDVPPPTRAIEWWGQEILPGAARDRLVAAFVGGPDIGHTHPDVPVDAAAAIVEAWLGRFDHGALRTFIDPDRPEGYVFSTGVIATDSVAVGLLAVDDND